MDAIKLKKVVIDTVKRLADDYFEDMQRHPGDYSEWVRTSDEDDCWLCAIEKAKDDMRQYPMACIDEDDQEEIDAQDWFFIWKITDDISWLTYNNLEVQRCFQGGV